MAISPHDSRWNQIAITVAGFVGFMGYTLVMPFLPLYFRELGVRDVGDIALWSGLSLGITPAMTAIGAPLWGRLSDRFGRKIMVEKSMVAFIIVMVGTAYATSPWQILALRMAQGVVGGYGGLVITMAADSVPRERMMAAIGTTQSAQRLGPAIGPLVGGVLAQIVGLRYTFLVAGAFYFFAFVLVKILYVEPPIAKTRPDKDGRSIGIRDVLKLENLFLLLLVVFSVQFVDRTLGPILPLYIGQLGIHADKVPLIAGVVFSVIAVSQAIGSFCTSLTVRVSSRTVIEVGLVMALLPLLILAITKDVVWMFVATVLFGLSIGLLMTRVYSVAGGIFPFSLRGTGFSVMTSSLLAGGAISPIFSGLLASKSIQLVFLFDALMLLGLAVIVRYTLPRVSRVRDDLSKTSFGSRRFNVSIEDKFRE